MKYQSITLTRDQLAELLSSFCAWCENYYYYYPDKADALDFLETQFNDYK